MSFFGGKKQKNAQELKPQISHVGWDAWLNPNANRFFGATLKDNGENVASIQRSGDTIDVQSFLPEWQGGLDKYNKAQVWGGNKWGSNPSGFSTDYSNYLKDSIGRYDTDKTQYSNMTNSVNSMLPQTNILSQGFMNELDNRQKASHDRAMEFFNRDFNDVVRGTANDYMNRFGSLNTSGFNNAMDRVERNYTRGATDIYNNTEINRGQNRAQLLSEQQQGLNNYITERNNTYGRLQDYENTLGTGLNYYQTLINQNDPNRLLPTMLQGQQLANSNLMDQYRTAYSGPQQLGREYLQTTGGQGGSNAFGGGLAGAGIGAQVGGPWGAAIGGGLGMLGGLFM